MALLALHPLCATCVFLLLRNDWPVRESVFAPLALFSLFPFALAGTFYSWTASDIYSLYFLSVVPVLWLALALGEAAICWTRSSMRREVGFACTLGVLVLIATGPVYALELKSIGWDFMVGTVPAAPLAYAAFLWAERRRRPLVHGRAGFHAKAIPSDKLRPGVHLIQELRPKYATDFARKRSKHGWPTWVFTRREHEKSGSRYGNARIVLLPPSKYSALRMASTVAKLSERTRGATFLIEDLSYLVSNSGLNSTIESISTLKEIADRRRCTIIVSLSLLVPAEMEKLSSVQCEYWRLPTLEHQVASIMEEELGRAAHHLLRIFCASKKIRQEDIDMSHIPELQGFLSRMISHLSLKIGDPGFANSGERQALSVSARLGRLNNITPVSLAKTASQSMQRDKAGADKWLVNATDLGFGEKAVDKYEGHDSLEGSDVRRVFKKVLGTEGEDVYRQTLRIIGMEEEDVAPDDLPTVLNTTEELLKLLEFQDSTLESIGKTMERSLELREMLKGIREVRHG